MTKMKVTKITPEDAVKMILESLLEVEEEETKEPVATGLKAGCNCANSYAEAAMRTINPEFTNRTDLFIQAALGLTGEAGEFADKVKKSLFQGHELTEDEMVSELGDILWYIVLGCKALGVSLGEVMHANIKKLEERYPEGAFSSKRSVNRKENKDVNSD